MRLQLSWKVRVRRVDLHGDPLKVSRQGQGERANARHQRATSAHLFEMRAVEVKLGGCGLSLGGRLDVGMRGAHQGTGL